MRTKKTSPSPLMSLPDDLGLNCLARVSSPDLAVLPLVCKKYRSLVASPDFKNMRSQLGCTEECLYVCFDLTLSWYVLRREKPKTTNDVHGLVMSPIPSCPSSMSRYSSVVVLDWGVYVIGGLVHEERTSNVMLLDCRTNTWRNVPSMRVARSNAAVGVVDGKIYVFGGCAADSLIWGEVFDPKTQTWDALVPMPDGREGHGYRFFKQLVMEEKVYEVDVWNGTAVYYSPSEGKWGREIRGYLVRFDDNGPLYWELLCGWGANLGKLLYGFGYLFGEMFWCESDKMKWKKVKGLETIFSGEKTKKRSMAQVSNFGVNIVLIWFEHKFENLESSYEIWCANISLKRVEEKGELWGTIEWSGVVKTLDINTFYRHPVGGVVYSASVNV